MRTRLLLSLGRETGEAQAQGQPAKQQFHFRRGQVPAARLAHQEEEAMREKLKKAMGYNDIAEFYMDQAMMGESEGAGLGLALVIILLKGEGIDPKLFRIMIREDRTIARLEIPFSEKFVSKRDVA